MSKHTFPVSGMTCAACVARVEKILNKNENVTNAKVNFATEKVTFETSNDFTSINILADEIKEYGYELQIDLVKNTSESQDGTDSPLSIDSKLIVALIFTIPIFLISMLYDFDFFQKVWFLNRQQTNILLFVLTTQ